MRITYTIYCELPVPPPQARVLLRDPELWAALPTGAERLGEFWRCGELYTPTLREHTGGMTWDLRPAGGVGPRLSIHAALRDAVVATHVTLTLALDAPLWPWQAAALQRRLVATADACAAALVERIRAAQVPEPPPTDPEELRRRFPATVAAFEAMGAQEHLERVARLEQGWRQIAAAQPDASVYAALPPDTQQPTFDLIYAGGGLALLHAAAMAHQGWRVLLFDRGVAGCAHREWNISRAELQALVEIGLVSWDDLRSVVMAEYRTGLVRFHSGPHAQAAHQDLWLPGVLDVALDAGALLRLARRKLEQAGGTILDQRAFRRVCVSAPGAPVQVAVDLESLIDRSTERFTGRLLLDGMGSTSPLALLRQGGHPFAGVCPTVGTVAEGFLEGNGPRRHDPTLGDILLTIDDGQRGQQLMWEGFPGRGDELTVYLFYYDTVGERPHSLLALFEDYFALLPTYKEPGPHFRHLKPVYGYIPARHSLHRQEAPLLRGILPIGDAAAQQSPLTFCGFGSHVRNLQRTTALLDFALRHDLTEPRHLRPITPFQANVSLNWVFSRFMRPWQRPDDVNELQNVFLGVLNDLGIDVAIRFFQDRMVWGDYHRMVLGTFFHYPKVFGIALQVLKPAGMVQWAADYLRYSGTAALATLARRAGPRVEGALLGILGRTVPALALQIRGRYAEWRAMGWI